MDSVHAATARDTMATRIVPSLVGEGARLSDDRPLGRSLPLAVLSAGPIAGTRAGQRPYVTTSAYRPASRFHLFDLRVLVSGPAGCPREDRCRKL